METSDNEDQAVASAAWKQFDLCNFEEQKRILLRRNQNTFSVEKRNHSNGIAKINQAGASPISAAQAKETGRKESTDFVF